MSNFTHNKWILHQNISSVTLFIRACKPSKKCDYRSLSRIGRKIWGKFPQQWWWWSIYGRHRGVSDDADPSHSCWIISEIRVKINQLWLCSSEHERLRGKSDTTSPTRLWRNISEIRGKFTQPWRLPSMDRSHWCESDGASERECLQGKSNDTSLTRILWNTR